MSRKGDCLDNAPMESFFHTLKTERVHHRIYATRTDARRDLFQYIEGFYNSRRLHTRHWTISPQRPPSDWRPNPVDFFGGRSARRGARRMLTNNPPISTALSPKSAPSPSAYATDIEREKLERRIDNGALLIRQLGEWLPNLVGNGAAGGR